MPEHPISQSPDNNKVIRKRRRLYDPIIIDPDTTKSVLPFPRHDVDTGQRIDRAHDIIIDHAMLSAGTGLFSVPLLDVAAMLTIELRMLKKLSDLYGIPFSKYRGKSMIASLVGGIHAGLWTSSCLKLIPLFGLAGVVLPMVAISGGITYAIGKVFVQHFESGGTLLDFRPEKMRKYYFEHFQKGQQVFASQPSQSNDTRRS